MISGRLYCFGMCLIKTLPSFLVGVRALYTSGDMTMGQVGGSFRLRHGASNCLSAYRYERDAELSESV